MRGLKKRLQNTWPLIWTYFHHIELSVLVLLRHLYIEERGHFIFLSDRTLSEKSPQNSFMTKLSVMPCMVVLTVKDLIFSKIVFNQFIDKSPKRPNMHELNSYFSTLNLLYIFPTDWGLESRERLQPLLAKDKSRTQQYTE